MTIQLRPSKLAAISLVALAFLAFATTAAATHFRFGTITWQIANPAAPREVKIRFDSAWRWSYAWPSPDGNFASACPAAPFEATGPTGSGACPPVGRRVYAVGGLLDNNGLIIITGPPGSGPTGGASRFVREIEATPEVRSINSAEDWMTATFEITTTLPNFAGNYDVVYQNEARISTLTDGNADQPYRVATRITLRLPPSAINQPPTASTIPIIRVVSGQTTTFPVPASDPNNDPISFRFATTAESGLVNTQPQGMSLNQSSGLVTFTQPATGLYAPQIVVSDPFGAYTVVDLLVEARPAIGQPPLVHINNTPGPKHFTLSPNNALSFNVSTRDPENTSVMLMGTGLPPGSTMSPSLPMVAPGNSSSNFTWTPPPSAIGTYILNFSALDGDGRQAFQTATIQVSNTPPTIQCFPPPAQALVATGPGGVSTGLGANVDDADDDLLTVRIFIDGMLISTSPLLNPPSGFGTLPMMFAVGTHPYVIDVSDGVSPPALCSGSFTVVDTGAPTLTVPADITVIGTTPASAVVTYAATATDAVDTAVGISCFPASGMPFPYGQTTVSCTATDDSGNTDTESFIVTVVDETPPTVTPVLTGTLGNNGWYTSNVGVSFTIADPQSLILSSTGCAAATVTGDSHDASFTCTATNRYGLITSVTVSVKRDATAPAVSHAVAAITAEATAASGAAVTFAAPTVTDATSGIAAASCTHTSGSAFPIGTTDVSCTATDSAGNSGSATLAITVADTTAPVIGALPNASGEATGPGGAPVLFATPSASDAVDSSVIVECVPGSGSGFPLGDTTVQCTAVDDAGNKGHKSMTVTVVDTTPPVIAPLGDITVDGSAAGGEAVSWPSSASDLVSGSVAVVCTPPSGSVFAYGLTPVTCSATDGSGNSSDANFAVRLNDTSPPVVTANVSGPEGDNGWYRGDVTISWIATDPQSGIATGCPAVVVGTDTAGNSYTCSATNGAGLVTTAEASVKRDATVPSVSHAVAAILAEATSAAGAIVDYAAPSISDALSGIAESSCSHPSGSVFPIGVTMVSCSAKDNAGNTASAMLAITVGDSVAPVIGDLPNVSAEASSAAGAVVTFAAPPAADDVDPAVSVLCAPPSGAGFALGETTVNCTATDDHGNASSKSMIVTVVDTTAPAIAPLDDITVDGSGAAGAVVSWAASATDLVSGNVSVMCDPVAGSTFGYGTTTVSCGAVDAAGNEASARFSVTVKDASPPIVTATVAGTAGAAGWYTSDVAISFTVRDAESAVTKTGCDPIAVSNDGPFSVTCSASSEGGTAAATASGQRDGTVPGVTVPGTVSAEATSAAGATVTYSGESASDATSGVLSFSCAPASGSSFPLGTTSVTCTATDKAGNVKAAMFDVIVADPTPPTVVPTVAGTLGSNDWYRGDVSLSWAIADPQTGISSSTGCGPVTVTADGTTNATCSATSAGGTTTGTVSIARDATVPTLSTSANVAVTTGNAGGTAVSYAAATAEDVTSGVASVSCLPASGSNFAIGTTAVTCTATDRAGNTSTRGFDVTVTLVVADTTPPVITSAAPNLSSLWPPNHQMVPITLSVAATDNNGAPACMVSSVTSNEPQNGLGDGDTPDDWLLTGGLTLQLRSERAGNGNGRVYTITVRCADGSGNAATRLISVTVPKSQKK